MLDALDVFIRFWELRIRHANLGEPLQPSEQIELLSLMQLVSQDARASRQGGLARRSGSLPAQLIGDGVIQPIEIRHLSAAAILATGRGLVSTGSRVVVRAADAVRGVDYVLPCQVTWFHPGDPNTMALVVDGIPTKNHFSSPPDAQARSALAMGRQEPLVG